MDGYVDDMMINDDDDDKIYKFGLLDERFTDSILPISLFFFDALSFAIRVMQM